jgi:hypothetical protein
MNDEARIEQLAKRLGSGAAERLDVHATARKVVEQLREAPAERATRVQPAWLRIAAAVVVLVGGGALVARITPGHRSTVSGHDAHYVADDLKDLSAAELRNVLASFDEIITTDSVSPSDSSNDLHQLDAQQLREVLRSLEG